MVPKRRETTIGRRGNTQKIHTVFCMYSFGYLGNTQKNTYSILYVFFWVSGKYPKEYRQDSKHGESLKSRMQAVSL